MFEISLPASPFSKGAPVGFHYSFSAYVAVSAAGGATHGSSVASAAFASTVFAFPAHASADGSAAFASSSAGAS